MESTIEFVNVAPLARKFCALMGDPQNDALRKAWVDEIFTQAAAAPDGYHDSKVMNMLLVCTSIIAQRGMPRETYVTCVASIYAQMAGGPNTAASPN